jgi:hypothetical protein
MVLRQISTLSMGITLLHWYVVAILRNFEMVRLEPKGA